MKIMAPVKAKKVELSNLEKKVLAAVRHLEHDPNAVPKRQKIAKKLRISPLKTQATLFKLRDLGFLKLHGARGGSYWTVKA